MNISSIPTRVSVHKWEAINSYVCDLSSNPADLLQVKMAFEVEKIYYLNPREILTSSQSDAWLSMFDATTIDYIHNLGESIDYNVMVVKYKMTYNKTDGSYECHSLFDGGDIIMKKNSGMTIIEIILSICIIAIVLSTLIYQCSSKFVIKMITIIFNLIL